MMCQVYERMHTSRLDDMMMWHSRLDSDNLDV